MQQAPGIIERLKYVGMDQRREVSDFGVVDEVA